MPSSDRWMPPESFDLRGMVDELRDLDDGEPDDSIPELEAADPSKFGATLCLGDGELRSAGDSEELFAIQSAVKPFLFALALADRGDDVLDAVGTEPTGEAFDAIRLESGTGRPPNPMVNAGALLTASLVDGRHTDDRTERILAGLGAFAGGHLDVSEKVSGSEQMLGDRNRALAHLMRGEGTLHVEVDEALHAYSDACAVLVSAQSLAVMGATLAFGGRNPITGEKVVSPEIATTVMAVMATCGVYDGSGRWMRRVGIAAKSGVSGALVLSVPHRLGAGIYSPPLDDQGTTVRGAALSERLSDDLHLHAFSTH